MKNGKIGVTTENIFPVIKKFLYSDHEIFLRELISNAVDATQKLKTLSSIGEMKGDLGDLTIRIAVDTDKRLLTITDRGIGMTADEVDLLLREGMKLAPSLEHTRILRAYAGVRPLVASDDDPSGRSVSRGIVVLDHATRDGLEGFVTITGGKLMTYRLMAEWTTDLICKKLNLTAKCTTAEEKLPGSRESEEEVNRRLISVPVAQRASSIHRHGDMAGKVAAGDAARRSLVCECEEVSVGEVEYALNELDVNNLVDLRRRTRVGMGTCQGELCACRAAGLMAEAGKYCVRRAKEDLTAFLNERWKGMAPVAWGDTLRESEFTMWLYDGVCGLTSANNTK